MAAACCRRPRLKILSLALRLSSVACVKKYRTLGCLRWGLLVTFPPGNGMRIDRQGSVARMIVMLPNRHAALRPQTEEYLMTSNCVWFRLEVKGEMAGVQLGWLMCV